MRDIVSGLFSRAGHDIERAKSDMVCVVVVSVVVVVGAVGW